MPKVIKSEEKEIDKIAKDACIGAFFQRINQCNSIPLTEKSE
jgi:hypothetical protein